MARVSRLGIKILSFFFLSFSLFTGHYANANGYFHLQTYFKEGFLNQSFNVSRYFVEPAPWVYDNQLFDYELKEKLRGKPPLKDILTKIRWNLSYSIARETFPNSTAAPLRNDTSHALGAGFGFDLSHKLYLEFSANSLNANQRGYTSNSFNLFVRRTIYFADRFEKRKSKASADLFKNSYGAIGDTQFSRFRRANNQSEKSLAVQFKVTMNQHDQGTPGNLRSVLPPTIPASEAILERSAGIDLLYAPSNRFAIGAFYTRYDYDKGVNATYERVSGYLTKVAFFEGFLNTVYNLPSDHYGVDLYYQFTDRLEASLNLGLVNLVVTEQPFVYSATPGLSLLLGERISLFGGGNIQLVLPTMSLSFIAGMTYYL